MSYRCAFTFVLFLVGAGALQAQITVRSITTVPETPSQGDMVEIRVALDAPAGCYPSGDETPDETDNDDGLLNVYLPACQSARWRAAAPAFSGFGLEPGVPVELGVTVGPVQVGVYSIQVFTPYDPDTPFDTHAFTVTDDDGGVSPGAAPTSCRISTARNVCNPGRGPCNLEENLLQAVRNLAEATKVPLPFPGWDKPYKKHPHGQLDPTFDNWGAGGSQNIPLLAAATALFHYPAGISPATHFPWEPWWVKFLDCQNGTSCPASSPFALQYFKGTELLSSTYDHWTTISVAAVRYWARIHGDTALWSKAGDYLRKTWALYALAAAPSFAVTLTYKTRGGDKHPTCQFDPDHMVPRFDGPFLATPGMRSLPSHSCDDDRGPLFADAVGWSYCKSNEQSWSRELRRYLDSRYGEDSSGENAWGVPHGVVQSLQGFMRPGSASGGVEEGNPHVLGELLGWLKGARAISRLDLFGWTGGLRAGVLEENHNHNTAAVFATLFTPRATFGGDVIMLDPFQNGRSCISDGKSSFDDNPPPSPPGRPRSVVATDRPLPLACGQPLEVTMFLPQQPWLWRVQLGRDADAVNVPY